MTKMDAWNDNFNMHRKIKQEARICQNIQNDSERYRWKEYMDKLFEDEQNMETIEQATDRSKNVMQ